ncbi:MAG: 16S rRNA (guanine(527)-N(7))-methyltransferase RsmG [Polyangiales bacterium]
MTPLEPTAAFTAALAELGLSVSHEAQQKLGAYLALLLAMNERVNLTAITTPDEAWLRHGLDALTLLPMLAALRDGDAVLDVGSGGGVPAIPLAIARPDLAFTLIESTKKKAAFLADVAKHLALANVTVVAERAEAMAGPLARRFDAVTARAVARIDELLAWTAPFAKPGARLLFIKGARADEELAEAKKSIARFKLAHEGTTLTPTGRIVAFSVAR